MKACILLQRRFAYVGHAIAIGLKKKYGIDQFCGYVYLRSSLDFLTSQKDIAYEKLLLDEDIHDRYKNEPLDLDYLRDLEKEYGLPNLWPYIEIDRVVRYGLLVREYPHDTPAYSHEEMVRILQVKAKSMIDFLKTEKPDFIIFSVVGDISTMLMYHIAKKLGIRTLFIQSTRIGIRYSLTEDYREPSFIKTTFEQLQAGTVNYPEQKDLAVKHLTDFRAKPKPYSMTDTPAFRPVTRVKQFSFLMPGNIGRSLKWTFRTFYDYLTSKHRNDFNVVKPWYYLLDHATRKLRVFVGYGGVYDKIAPGEDFAFFPLQLEPEMSSSLFAPFYTDQLWLAKQIARSLPVHYKLYIKEHPAMFGYRQKRFYKELKKIPNVKLLPPELPSLNFLQHAKLIVTTTGTAGWEGLLLKKPVITFGNAFYNILPMVKNCKAIEDLPHLVHEQLSAPKYDETALVDFIAAIYKESADLDMEQIWNIEGGSNLEKKEERVKAFVDLIAQKLNLHAK